MKLDIKTTKLTSNAIKFKSNFILNYELVNYIF